MVQPSKVEIPKSMASVAVAWNLPMHYWLKTCKFIFMSIFIMVYHMLSCFSSAAIIVYVECDFEICRFKCSL